MNDNNIYRSGGRNYRNNQNYGSSRNLGNRNDRNNQQRGPQYPKNKNGKFQNQEQEKRKAGVTIRYDKAEISKEKVKHSFVIYGETHETTVNTHEYIGSSDEKL